MKMVKMNADEDFFVSRVFCLFLCHVLIACCILPIRVVHPLSDC